MRQPVEQRRQESEKRSRKPVGWGQPRAKRHPMDYTHQFEDHLREHRPSRVGQRLWWIPAAAGICVIIAEGVYLATTPTDQLSHTLAVALPFIAAFLVLVAWAALSIADWTYPAEKYYREAQHAAASQAAAYILAGRRARGQPPNRQAMTTELRVSPSGSR
jgi:hypothetical protein